MTKSQVILSFSNINKKQKGFSLIELLVVIGVFMVLASFVVPVGIGFYRSQQLDSVLQEIIFSLRGAQQKAMLVESDSSFGVRFEEKNYILFKGNSYNERDVGYDETFLLPGIIEFGGVQDVVFLKPFGVPQKSQPYCGGTCQPCSQFNNAPSCRRQDGCSWVRGNCEGSCNFCGGFSVEESCLAQISCQWLDEEGGGEILINAENEIRVISINEIGRINLE